MQGMPRKFPQAALRSLAGLAALLGVLVLLRASGAPVVDALRYERGAIAAGEVWRLLTCHFVHYDNAHLALNAAGLATVWLLYGIEARLSAVLAVAGAAALAVGAGLYFLRPEIVWYLGLSGVLHGAWAAGACVRLATRPRESALALGVLVLHLVLEPRLGSLSGWLGTGLPVIHEAHVYGAVGGAIAGVLVLAAGRGGARL